MKQLYSFLLFVLLGSFGARAQSFSLQSGDTVYVNPCFAYSSHNNVVNHTSGDVRLEWKVIENTYPADWFPSLGICDNKTCASGSDIYVGAINETEDYKVVPTNIGDFHITGDLTSTATYGPYVLRVRLNNKAIPTDTAIATFIVTKCGAPANVSSVTDNDNSVQVYPNPATSVVNVVYNAAAEVRSIAIYSVTGKHIISQQVTGDRALVNVEKLPAGTYFVRLLNENGNAVATRRFNCE